MISYSVLLGPYKVRTNELCTDWFRESDWQFIGFDGITRNSVKIGLVDSKFPIPKTTHDLFKLRV